MERPVLFSPKVEIYGDKNAIVEFQAFKGNSNEFIIKELVILDLSTGIPNYFLFKPPFEFANLERKYAKTNNWCTKKYHFITWDEGFTHYGELDEIMYYYCSQYTTLFTTGVEKCNWLRMYTTSRVVERNLSKELKEKQNLLCISVKNPRHKIQNCALAKAYNLATTFGKDLNNVSPTYVENGGGKGNGGGSEYKCGIDASTFHEYCSNLREERYSSSISSQANEQQIPNIMSNRNLQDITNLFNQHSKSTLLVTKKCYELKEERRYAVHAFKRIDTSVGDGIIATLSEAPYKNGDHPKFQIFLPKRFVITLQNEDLESIQPGTLYIVSHGSSGNNSTELSLEVNE